MDHMETVNEWGYRTPDGKVHKVNGQEANEGYMTALEYAIKRADRTGGTVVRRPVTTRIADWEQYP